MKISKSKGLFRTASRKNYKAVLIEWEVEKIGVELPYGLPKLDIKRLAKDESAREKVREALKNDTYLFAGNKQIAYGGAK